MVRTAGGGARPVWANDYSDDDQGRSDSEEEQVSEEEYNPSPNKKVTKSPKLKSAKTPKTPRGKISPSKTPASKRKFNSARADSEEPVSKKKKKKVGSANLNSSRASGRAKPSIKYSYDSGEENQEEDESEDDEPVIVKKGSNQKGSNQKGSNQKGRGRPSGKAVKGRPTPTKGRLPLNSSRSTGRPPKKAAYYSEEEEDDSDIQEIDPSDYEDEPPRRKGAGKSTPKYGKTKMVTQQKERKIERDFPPVSEMVIESIKALKDPPKKGSTLRTIKETIALNWPINMRIYDVKIKKYLKKALETGDIIQTKGKGFSGRFTVKGLKTKKKKARKNSLTKVYDEDLVEYQPKKTKRDEERVKDQEELERRRIERMLWEERMKVERAEERAKQPKKPVAKREDFEVEAIKGAKEVDGKKYYLVKFLGFEKKTWEPEAHVEGCQDLIDLYYEEERKKEEELAEIRRRAEEEGVYEVKKIQEVKFNKDDTRVFLIRWKGHGPEGDTWEPEANLDCKDLIESFMAKWEKVQDASEKNLREAPKKVKRLAFSSSHRVGKRNQGFRVTYEDMDE